MIWQVTIQFSWSRMVHLCFELYLNHLSQTRFVISPRSSFTLGLAYDLQVSNKYHHVVLFPRMRFCSEVSTQSVKSLFKIYTKKTRLTNFFPRRSIHWNSLPLQGFSSHTNVCCHSCKVTALFTNVFPLIWNIKPLKCTELKNRKKFQNIDFVSWNEMPPKTCNSIWLHKMWIYLFSLLYLG